MSRLCLLGMLLMLVFTACEREKEGEVVGEQIEEEFNFGPNTGD